MSTAMLEAPELLDKTTHKRLLLLTSLIAVVLVFWSLGEVALLSFNEARRALPAREMFVSSDWLLPHLNGDLYITKPPFLYWLQTLFALTAGHVNEWTVRLPSAFSALAVLVMVYQFTSRTIGKWQALFAVQLLLANTSFTMFARRAEIEMLLTALCLAAFLAAVWYIRYAQTKVWLYASYIFLALALLTKGPLVLILVTLPILLLAIYEKDQPAQVFLKSIGGWLVFLVLGLSWYLAVSLKLGFDIWSTVAHQDLAKKMTGEDSKPLLSYLAWIAVDFLPVILILLYKPRQWLSYFREHAVIRAICIGVLIPLVIFSLFSNKHAKYLLPIYPMISIVLASYLVYCLAHAKAIYQKLVSVLAIVIPLGFTLFYGLAEAKLYEYRTSAFPEFQRWATHLKSEQIYAYEDIDERMFFYSPKKITVINKIQLSKLLDAKSPFILLIQPQQETDLLDVAHCKMVTIKPYLKRDKVLDALGFGEVCAEAQQK